MMRSNTTVIEQVQVRMLPDGRLTRRCAANYLGLAEKTLACWHVDGKGPRAVKVGGRVFYFKDDLDKFIAEGATNRLSPAAQ